MRSRPVWEPPAPSIDVLNSGSHVIAMDDLYCGAFPSVQAVHRRSAMELDFTFMDLNNTAALKNGAQTQHTTMIYRAKTPTNPMLKLINLSKLGAFTAEHSLIIIINNTFCSPMVSRFWNQPTKRRKSRKLRRRQTG